MIATRLHAQRHSSSTLHRPSITSIHNTPHSHSHTHTHQHHGRTNRRLSEDVQHIDSDHNEDDDDNANEIHEGTKVEKTFLSFSTTSY
jgi:hypothetical protein